MLVSGYLYKNQILNCDDISEFLLWIIFIFTCLCLQVCPVCSKRVGMDIVGHIMAQHGSIFKISFSFFVTLLELALVMFMFWTSVLLFATELYINK